MNAAPASMAAVNPAAPASSTIAGTTTTPLRLAPLSARLIASPRLVVNHNPRILVMAPTLMPAQPTAISR